MKEFYYNKNKNTYNNFYNIKYKGTSKKIVDKLKERIKKLEKLRPTL